MGCCYTKGKTGKGLNYLYFSTNNVLFESEYKARRLSDIKTEKRGGEKVSLKPLFFLIAGNFFASRNVAPYYVNMLYVRW